MKLISKDMSLKKSVWLHLAHGRLISKLGRACTMSTIHIIHKLNPDTDQMVVLITTSKLDRTHGLRLSNHVH